MPIRSRAPPTRRKHSSTSSTTDAPTVRAPRATQHRRLRAPMDDPMIDDFRDNLDPINALAEQSPGFVWRLQDDSGNATGIKPFGDELEIVNLSVWESIDALADFAYRSAHNAILRRRREFFEAPG